LDFYLALFPSVKPYDTQRIAHEDSRKTHLFFLKAKAKASTQLGTFARVGVYQHPTAGRKIQRPANYIKIFSDFARS